ncbi:hypothetical protein [Microbacterium lacticum]
MTHDSSWGEFVDVIEIDDRAFRIRVRAGADACSAPVLAYVEQVDGGFEVVWTSGSRRRAFFATLDECAEAAASRIGDHTSSGPIRPVPIPHLPPLPG